MHSIYLKQFSDVDSMLPTRMRELVTSMRRIGRGLGVISKFRMDLELVGALMPEDPDNLAFCNSGIRDAFGHSPDLCAHIETKLSGQDLQNALTQLGVWFRANFTRLGELAVESDARPVTAMPPLLGIIIQGHEWYLHLGLKVGDEVWVVARVQFGNTLTPLGVNQIVQGLQVIAKYSAETFLPWFQSNSLGMT